MKKQIWGGVALGALLVALTGNADAQHNLTRFEQLEARVAELEAEKADRSRLKFNVSSNTELEIYGFVRFEAFYDFDTAQGDLTRTRFRPCTANSLHAERWKRADFLSLD